MQCKASRTLTMTFHKCSSKQTKGQRSARLTLLFLNFLLRGMVGSTIRCCANAFGQRLHPNVLCAGGKHFERTTADRSAGSR
eukprot:4686509-Lingulodinium_polyedra.AAC.1